MASTLGSAGYSDEELESMAVWYEDEAREWVCDKMIESGGKLPDADDVIEWAG
jgi:hypothetical protein